MHKLLAAIVMLAVITSASALEPRSQKQRRLFMLSHPCPSTGLTRGACPGHVVDHIKARACGGADRPSNMQWQTIAEGKAKDRIERKGCPKKPA